jgi:cysteine-rich repeat protein
MSTGVDSEPVRASTSTSTSTEESGGATEGETAEASAGPGAESGEGSSSTGAPGPVCGDGVVEGEETCDDGNDEADDGCQMCEKDSVVFVTSEVYKGYKLGGLSGASQRCRSLAAKAGLGRPETYMAWLSTPSSPVGERMKHSRGRYVLVNGLVVARDWEELTSGTLQQPIMVDEHSQTQDTRAWTGTLASGAAAPGVDYCGEWEHDLVEIQWGGTGLSPSVDATWSFFEDGPCFSELHPICIEQ